MLEEHFKNLLENIPEVTDKPTDKIIYSQDTKLEHFVEEELDAILKKIKSRKAASLDEIPP